MMSHRWSAIALSLLLSVATTSASAQMQESGVRRGYAPVPFGPGERMSYAIRLSPFGKIGNGLIEVQDIDTIRGHDTYQLRLNVEGGIPFAHVKNNYTSWFDTDELFSRRFKTDVSEVKYKRKRTFELFPSERMWRRSDKPSEFGPLMSTEPLDELAFIYFARTLPLEVGKTYTFNRYFKQDGNPVTVQVLRRDTVETPAGRFRTIAVKPIIRTDGIFSEGGQAEIHFTDDDRRIPVLIKISLDIPLLKSLTMYLQKYDPGTRVAPAFTAPNGSN